MADYIPKRYGDIATWLQNLAVKLPDQAKTLNLTPAQVKEALAQIDELTGSIAKNEQKRAEYQAAVRTTQSLKRKYLPALRKLVKVIKVQPGYQDSVGADLAISVSGRSSSSADVQPVLRVEALTDGVRLKFTKGKTDGVNVYGRLAGEVSWTFLGRDNRSPYFDRRPLRQLGTPEVREYQVRAVRHDEELGIPSHIASVTLA